MLMKEKMNCKMANRISIIDYLKSKGYFPAFIKGNDYWYNSPFKSEKKPSFHVNIVLNRWYNFQDGTGSTLIDLVVRLENCNEKEALKLLSNGIFSFHQPVKSTTQQNERIIIKEVKDLSNKYLIEFLKKRKVTLDLGRKYCKEVYYEVDGRTYYAVGFMNNSGGFELRSAFWQGACKPKDITLINNNSQYLCVFEGFFDFLSYLEITKIPEDKFDYLILNSNSNIKEAIKYLINYKEVFFFLDNDDSGDDTFSLVLKVGVNCTDCSGIYEGMKDVNDYLVEVHDNQPQWFIDQFLHLIKFGVLKEERNNNKDRNRGISR